MQEDLATTKLKKEEITLGEEISRGQYGAVFVGKCRGSKVAVKIPRLERMKKTDLEAFYEEIQQMCKFRHPNIILLMVSFLFLKKIPRKCTKIIFFFFTDEREHISTNFQRRFVS